MSQKSEAGDAGEILPSGGQQKRQKQRREHRAAATGQGGSQHVAFRPMSFEFLEGKTACQGRYPHHQGVGAKSGQPAELKKQTLQQQADSNREKGRGPEQNPDQPWNQHMDTGWPQRHVNQGGNEKGRGDDRHFRQVFFSGPSHAPRGDGYGCHGASQGDADRQDSIGNMHEALLPSPLAAPGHKEGYSEKTKDIADAAEDLFCSRLLKLLAQCGDLPVQAAQIALHLRVTFFKRGQHLIAVLTGSASSLARGADKEKKNRQGSQSTFPSRHRTYSPKVDFFNLRRVL